MAERPSPPSECANCGAKIPRGARACPECGADEQTGWRDTSLYDGLDLPDSAWRDEEDEAADRTRSSPRVNGIAWYWWAVAVIVLAGFAALVLGLR